MKKSKSSNFYNRCFSDAFASSYAFFLFSALFLSKHLLNASLLVLENKHTNFYATVGLWGSSSSNNLPSPDSAFF